MPGRASDDDAELVGRLSLSITRLARVLRQQDPSRSTPAASSALATIVRDGPLTLGALAAAERVSPSTITKIVNKLEADGVIERTIDPRDRRVHRIQLSAVGRRRVQSYRSKRNAWLTEQLRPLLQGDRTKVEDVVAVLEQLTATEGSDPLDAGG